VFSVTTTVGDDIWVASQHLTLYADAGTEIRVGQGRGTSSGNAFILASLSGHLIDCSVAPCQ